MKFEIRETTTHITYLTLTTDIGNVELKRYADGRWAGKSKWGLSNEEDKLFEDGREYFVGRQSQNFYNKLWKKQFNS